MSPAPTGKRGCSGRCSNITSRKTTPWWCALSGKQAVLISLALGRNAWCGLLPGKNPRPAAIAKSSRSAEKAPGERKPGMEKALPGRAEHGRTIAKRSRETGEEEDKASCRYCCGHLSFFRAASADTARVEAAVCFGGPWAFCVPDIQHFMRCFVIDPVAV